MKGVKAVLCQFGGALASTGNNAAWRLRAESPISTKRNPIKANDNLALAA